MIARIDILESCSIGNSMALNRILIGTCVMSTYVMSILNFIRWYDSKQRHAEDEIDFLPFSL